MKSPFSIFVRKYGVFVIVALLLVTGVTILGMTGKCPLCSKITTTMGLSGPSLISGKSSETGTSGGSNNKVAANWSLADINGKTVSLADFKGKVVILDFWATWCPPCRAEIPGFIEIQSKYAAKGLTVIGLSLDDNPMTVAKFVKENGINYPVVMADESTIKAYGGFEGIPTTFIIDRAGRVVEVHTGFTEQDAIEKVINGLF